MVAIGDYEKAFGAGVLVTANVICLNLSGIITFLVQGVRPRTWWEADRAIRSTRVAITVWSILLLLLVVLLVVSYSATE